MPESDGGAAGQTAVEHPGQSCPAEWPVPLRALTSLSRVLSVLEGAGIIFFLLATIVLATWQCVERNLVQHHLPFFRTPPWIDGVIRHSVFLLGFIGGAYATFSARHIRIDAVTRVLSVRKRLVLRVLTTLVALALVTLFTYAAWGVYKLCLEESGDAAQSEQLFTTARGAMVMVIGYAVIAFHFLVQIALDVGWLASGKEPPASYISEASAH
jgi:TRAP-type C4-dicarboxylate transport system permease small subunit